MSRTKAKTPVRKKAIAAVAPQAPTVPDKGNKKTVVVDLAASMKGALKAIGGSKADDWNDVIANQAVNTVWKTGNEETDNQRTNGVLSAV